MSTKKTVIISGGSEGLGKSIASELRREYHVIIFSQSETKGINTANELGVEYIKGDVTNYANCEQLTKIVFEKYGSIDVVINNAGVWIQGQVASNKPQDIHRAIDVNSLGAVNLTRASISYLEKQQSGTIIIINSQAGLYPKEERSVYNLTKWGLTGFAKSLQPELAKKGIRVVSIHPGKMKTEMFSKMGIIKDMSDGLDTKYVAQSIKFILSLPDDVIVPEFGIKNIRG